MVTRRYDDLQKTHQEVAAVSDQAREEATPEPARPQGLVTPLVWSGQGDMVTENQAANALNARLQAEAKHAAEVARQSDASSDDGKERDAATFYQAMAEQQHREEDGEQSGS